jgi:hypothetical protein
MFITCPGWRLPSTKDGVSPNRKLAIGARYYYGGPEVIIVFRAIKTFIKDPEPTDKLGDVVPGLNLVEGIVTMSEPLRSPVRGQNCAAFTYRSYFIIEGGRAPAFHKVKEAEVYSSFELEMDGGTLSVVPKKPGKFEQAEHQALQKKYGKDFQGVEEVILPGARVRLRGKVSKLDDELVLTMSEITVLDKQVVATGVVGDRKKRKKKKQKD